MEEARKAGVPFSGEQIKEIQMFSTVIVTQDLRTVTIPNGRILKDSIVNYSQLGVRRVDMVFTHDMSSWLSFNIDKDWLEENISWKDFDNGVRLGKLKREENVMTKLILTLQEAYASLHNARLVRPPAPSTCMCMAALTVWVWCCLEQAYSAHPRAARCGRTQ